MAVTTMWNRRCYQYDCETPTQDSDLRCVSKTTRIFSIMPNDSTWRDHPLEEKQLMDLPAYQPLAHHKFLPLFS